MANPNDILNRLLGGTASNPLAATVDQLSGAGSSDSVRGLTTQLEQLRGLFQTQTTTTKENTDALLKSATAQTSTVASTVSQVARTATSTLGGGLALSPLITGLLKLFGRDQQEAPPTLPTFSLPRSVAVDGSIQGGGSSAIATTQYAQDGLPRVINNASAGQQITVQVHAMDSRSFLDRSDDIARAVKEAMLNSHSVNDVIGEL